LKRPREKERRIGGEFKEFVHEKSLACPSVSESPQGVEKPLSNF